MLYISNIRRKLAIYCIAVYGICIFMLWYNLPYYVTPLERLSNLSKLQMNVSTGKSTETVPLYTKTYIQWRQENTRPSNELAHHILVQNLSPTNNARLKIRSSTSSMPINKIKTHSGNNTFYLTNIVRVRIYDNDKAKWTIKELKQWLHYLFYAGVGHVYLCDHFLYFHERLKASLLRYVENNLLTYIEWPWNASSNRGNTLRHQALCYSHVIKKYGTESRWQMSIDMDEYPFVVNDTTPAFLSNFLKKKEKTLNGTSQILMQNFLMLGQGNRSKTMTIERITRITKTKANALTKPIYKVQNIAHPDIHIHQMKSGSTLYADEAELHMLHYWGARMQNWGPDTNKTFEMTREFSLVRDFVAPAVRSRLINFGELYAFSNNTGP